MGNALRHVRGESQKNIVRFIEGLSGKYSRWDIWQDFIIMSAIAIANTMGGPQVKVREYTAAAQRSIPLRSWKSLQICCLRS